MSKLSKQEISNFRKFLIYASPKELWSIIYWDIFKRYKINKLIKCLNDGRSWKSSFYEAKQLKNK